jgi:hypothetical protein
LHGNPEKIYDVELRIEFTSSLPYFDSDTDMDVLTVAKGIALEPWSREYFDTVKK